MGLSGVPEQQVDDFILRRFAEGALEGETPWPDLTVDEMLEKVDGGIGRIG
jgi:hypothetical protein